jgi:hypothetical protein
MARTLEDVIGGIYEYQVEFDKNWSENKFT